MKIENASIDVIKPYWRNPRKNADAVEAVKQSIKRYGFNQPLVLDMDGTIIVGHTRYKAMLEMGVKAVPCVYIDIDPKKAKEYRIADNKTGELAQWDIPDLKLEIRELEDFSTLPGFGELELSTLLDDISFATGADPTKTLSGPMGSMGSFGNYDPDKEQQKFDETQGKLDNRFSEQSDQIQSDYIEATCPHCAKTFILDRKELMA